MPRNGSGVYSPPGANYPAVSGTTITAANRNAVDADIATALTGSIAVNGESVVTGNIPFAGNKITGIGAATARTDAASIATIQDGTGVYVGTVGGTADVITLTPSPAIAAYTAGQLFSFIASGANTTNVTINVNGLGAKAITKNGTTALASGDIPSGFLVTVRYDGTRFQLIGAKDVFTGGTLTGDITMSGASIIEAEGAAVASASSTNIWATDGNTRHVTGNTTINDFATAPQAGARMKLIFDGTPQLTQSANLNLNGGGANITMAVDDWAEVYADTTTQFDVVVHRKSGASVTGGTAASTSAPGVVELATTAEMAGRTDTTRAVTAESLQGIITSGTAIATTSGTSHDFTSIPSWAKRITLMLSGVSTNGTSVMLVQLGDAGGIENTGYLGAGSGIASTVSTTNYTTGAGFNNANGTVYVNHGIITICLVDSSTNTWVISGTIGFSGIALTSVFGSSKSLSAALTQIRLTTVNGTDAFDAGIINIVYE